jgi:hypothetical protein
MNTLKIVPNLAGPELGWMVAYGMVVMITSQNKPATDAGNERLENIAMYLLIGVIILSFLPLLWAVAHRGWWLMRIGVAGLIGIYLLSSELCESILYHDSRDSGVGTLFILMIIFGWILLGLGLLGAALSFRFPDFMLPLLKWLGIGTGLVVLLVLLVHFIAKLSGE